MNLDPIAEMENVQTELILSDIEVCHKKKSKVTLCTLKNIERNDPQRGTGLGQSVQAT